MISVFEKHFEEPFTDDENFKPLVGGACLTSSVILMHVMNHPLLRWAASIRCAQLHAAACCCQMAMVCSVV